MATKTDSFTIHYSERGAHIVPAVSRGRPRVMHVETDFKKACRYFLQHGCGAFYTDEGAMVSGDFANYESETDSSNGIANVSILTAPGTIQDVYEDDFVPRHWRCRRYR